MNSSSGGGGGGGGSNTLTLLPQWGCEVKTKVKSCVTLAWGRGGRRRVC